jgi:hypothetical protein
MGWTFSASIGASGGVLVSSSLASPCLMEANTSASFTTSIRAMNGIETWMDILPKPVQSAWEHAKF